MLKIHNMMLGQHNDLLDQSFLCELLTGNQNFVRTSKTDSDQTVWMPGLPYRKVCPKSRYTDLALINGLWPTCSKIISLLCRTQVNLTLGIFCTFSCKKRKFELLRRLNFVDSKFSTSGYLMRICYVTA